MVKSPFLIVKNFISPLECEKLLASIETELPNYDRENKPIKTTSRAPVFQQRIWNRFEQYFEKIEKYYSVEINSVTPIDIEWYPERCVQESSRCENSQYIGNKWMIRNDYDLTVVVFLKDYNDTPEFDEEFECYGGKLEMVNHAFAVTPTRGVAVIFPSNQYFINRTESPTYGDAFQIRFHVTCTERFVYDKQAYEGDYTIWFKS